jgi:hypothetical protein
VSLGKWSVRLCSIFTLGFALNIALLAAQAPPATSTQAGQSRVVIYRVKGFADGRAIKPSIYCDGKELALMYVGRYFTVTLTPGPHTISSSDEKKSLQLDTAAGETYYARIFNTGKWVAAWYGVRLEAAKQALADLKKLKPSEAKHVVASEIVSIQPFSK